MRLLLFVAFSLLITRAFCQDRPDELLSIVQTELKREMAELGKANQPPYYLAYRINEMKTGSVTSSFGSLISARTNQSRILVTEIKVGDYTFDNTHPIRDFDNVDIPYDMPHSQPIALPLDNRGEAIQLMVWKQTQEAYREALGLYKALKNVEKPATEPVADFSKEKPSEHIDPALPDFKMFYNEKEWAERIKKFSASFVNHADIVEATADLQVGLERKYFLSSEGARIAENRMYAYLSISASVRAADGDIVPMHKSYFAFEPSQLPADEIILRDVENMINKLKLLRTAPVAEPYTGPAILYAHAAGVFFHEIFGHRVEGHRLKDMNDGQTFKGKVHEQVLPKSLSVVFDPTLSKFNEQPLNGYYQYDDQGVMAQKVKVVENGVLKTFLMSRSPLKDIPNSNGHGRAEAGAEAVARQSNLIIQNEKPVQMSDLRKMLISECKKQKRSYGYLFMDVMGGFTTTDRYMPNAFNIFPTEVYRIYTDGRPDELVRGVDLIGTPLAMFAEIKAADNKSEVFTGFCGAESGSVPVTAISPSLFVKRIETQKKPMTQIENNLLAMPANK